MGRDFSSREKVIGLKCLAGTNKSDKGDLV